MVDTPIVSEALQKEFRDNFPSQVNSGRDLHVSDVVVPIVDFSTTVGTTGLNDSLQQALDINVTTFNVNNTTTTVINTTGFWRIQGVSIIGQMSGGSHNMDFKLTDGVTSKVLFDFFAVRSGGNSYAQTPFDFIVIVKSGFRIDVSTDLADNFLIGNCRQIADLSGTLQNPDGYTGS